ncbi:MAG: glutamine synthetase III [Deltaproteobacteria bacterium]|nr:glutamine synthetase III [Deltaproteobacteria bacterium]
MSIGTSAKARFKIIQEITQRTTRKFDPPRDENGRKLKISEFYGMNTFNLDRMREKLPKDVFHKLQQTIETGKKLDSEIADSVAQAIKDWAQERGVTHFCHWFQPQTGSTAEKHDAFLSLDKNKRPVEKFSGSQLIQSEPDASSFPSGGMRTTFEARGYTAWDPSSPVFIMDTVSSKTLCIPSVFISYHGDALDEKTALIRSVEVLSQKACELLYVLGEKDVKRIVPTLGAEQEYFLIDRGFYNLRPDLIMTGRTLVGGQPPKGQQLEDHYFGSIATRVQAFMSEMEYELYKLGVPVKTRHNEVAPSQFETAPIFEEVNLSTDHNQLTMEILRKVALRHHLMVLLHEKPFAGINGSGKHNNWSLMVTASGVGLDGDNLLEPGKTPHQNIRFLLIVVSVLKGVMQHAGLLRAGIASAGNDHRLGANEAPPAIISAFLGDLLNSILDNIESGADRDKNPEAAVIRLEVSKLPEVMRDNTDRNRTSPFAFTGNKFEFRAVGSSFSTAFPITLLNAVVADGLEYVTQLLKKKSGSSKGGKTPEILEKAALETLKEVIRETKAIRFEGNNYAEEWIREAEKRGLPNLKKTPEALAQLVSPVSKEMLIRLGVFSEAEIVSRFHVRIERYIKNIMIEVDTLKSLVDTMILPACYAWHGFLAATVGSAKQAGVSAPQAEVLTRLGNLITSLHAKRVQLEVTDNKAESLSTDEEKARAFSKEVTVAMDDVRVVCDELEAMVADDYWPLPKYREMLFIS